MYDYGKSIKDARKLAGLTQKALAEKSGLATITIQQYERGLRKPGLDQIMRICGALDIDIDKLLHIKPLPACTETLYEGTEMERTVTMESGAQELDVFDFFLEGMGYMTMVDSSLFDNPKGKDGDVWLLGDVRERKVYVTSTEVLDKLKDSIVAYTKFQMNELTAGLEEADEKNIPIRWKQLFSKLENQDGNRRK